MSAIYRSPLYDVWDRSRSGFMPVSIIECSDLPLIYLKPCVARYEPEFRCGGSLMADNAA
jgi:hypothetical protein